MGPASHKGLSVRADTTATEANASNKLLDRAEGNDHQGHQRTTGQGCSSREHPISGRLCITDLPGSKEGGQRPVINLKALNRFVKHEQFKMEGLHILPSHLIQAEDWMIKLDLKDAYLQIPIHVEWWP